MSDSLRGSKVMRQGDSLITEEPYDRIGHVRIWCAMSTKATKGKA